MPAFELANNKDTLNILDICFGIGYNTFATVYYCITNNIKTKINIYSPELDKELINSLKEFNYPKEFDLISNIIDELLANHFYKNNQFNITLYIGNAIDYINQLDNIDIVYQDAFSSEVNKELWSVDYFKTIKEVLNTNALITTYSISTPVRLSMYENSLFIYEHILNNNRKATLSSNYKIRNSKYKLIDMEHKKSINPNIKSIMD